MNKLTLVVLAAGMGSRFGGLKQIEPIGPNGEFIIDYSVYDAIKAGFEKVVFVIKKENYDIFRKTIGKRIEGKVEVGYAFQDLADIPVDVKLPKDRVKPLGTAHAIYAARNLIEGDFAFINSDDYYGKESFVTLANFLKKQKDSENQHYCLVGYKASNTMTENGSVKRGVCEIKDNYLVKLIESKLERVNGVIMASPLNGDPSFALSDDTLVSMNMMGFKKGILNYIEDNFINFFNENKDNLDTCEYLMPNLVYKAIQEGYASVEVLKTNAKWYGVTYKEDKEQVVKAINNMIKKGEIPENLWK